MNENEKQAELDNSVEMSPHDSTTTQIEEPSNQCEEERGILPTIESEGVKLISLLFKEPGMAHLIGDIMEGIPAQEAVARNFSMKNEPKTIDEEHFAEVIEELNIPADTLPQMVSNARQMYSRISQGEVSPDITQLIIKGMNYDTALAQAGEKGYLQGRNEKIELLNKPALHRQNASEQQPPQHYTSILGGVRRSVWDD